MVAPFQKGYRQLSGFGNPAILLASFAGLPGKSLSRYMLLPFGVEHLLDGLGDGGFDLLGTRTGQAGEDRDGGALDFRQEVHAEAAVGDGAHHHEGHRHHGGEDRPPDADLREVHGRRSSARASGSVLSTRTGAPS